jgi:hypothetical protein
MPSPSDVLTLSIILFFFHHLTASCLIHFSLALSMHIQNLSCPARGHFASPVWHAIPFFVRTHPDAAILHADQIFTICQAFSPPVHPMAFRWVIGALHAHLVIAISAPLQMQDKRQNVNLRQSGGEWLHPVDAAPKKWAFQLPQLRPLTLVPFQVGKRKPVMC